MKTWIIAGIILLVLVAGLFVTATVSNAKSVDASSYQGCGKCSGKCTQDSNCGLEGCTAKTTGSCNCGK